MRLIADGGFKSATFASIAEEAGISRGLVGYHFHSKAKLIEAVVQHIRDEFARDVTGPSGEPTQSGMDAIMTMVSSYLNRLAQGVPNAKITLILSTVAVSEPSEVGDSIRELFAGMRGDFSAWIRRGMADGTVRPGIDPESHGSVLEAILRGITIQALVERETFDFEGAHRAAIETIERTLAPP